MKSPDSPQPEWKELVPPPSVARIEGFVRAVSQEGRELVRPVPLPLGGSGVESARLAAGIAGRFGGVAFDPLLRFRALIDGYLIRLAELDEFSNWLVLMRTPPEAPPEEIEEPVWRPREESSEVVELPVRPRTRRRSDAAHPSAVDRPEPRQPENQKTPTEDRAAEHVEPRLDHAPNSRGDQPPPMPPKRRPVASASPSVAEREGGIPLRRMLERGAKGLASANLGLAGMVIGSQIPNVQAIAAPVASQIPEMSPLLREIFVPVGGSSSPRWPLGFPRMSNAPERSLDLTLPSPALGSAHPAEPVGDGFEPHPEVRPDYRIPNRETGDDLGRHSDDLGSKPRAERTPEEDTIRAKARDLARDIPKDLASRHSETPQPPPSPRPGNGFSGTVAAVGLFGAGLVAGLLVRHREKAPSPTPKPTDLPVDGNEKVGKDKDEEKSSSSRRKMGRANGARQDASPAYRELPDEPTSRFAEPRGADIAEGRDRTLARGILSLGESIAERGRLWSSTALAVGSWPTGEAPVIGPHSPSLAPMSLVSISSVSGPFGTRSGEPASAAFQPIAFHLRGMGKGGDAPPDLETAPASTFRQPRESLDPAYGELTLVAPPIRVASRQAEAAGSAVQFDWGSLATGAGELDASSLASLQAVLPEGAQAIYPALPTGSLGTGGINLRLSRPLLTRLLSAGYGSSRAATAAENLARRPSSGIARPASASLVPYRAPAGSRAASMFAEEASGTDPAGPGALGEAGAGQAKRGGVLDFLGVPVRMAPSLGGRSDLRDEVAVRNTAKDLHAGKAVDPEKFGSLQRRLFTGNRGVEVEPDKAAWRKAAPEFRLKSAEPMAILAPDARKPMFPPPSAAHEGVDGSTDDTVPRTDHPPRRRAEVPGMTRSAEASPFLPAPLAKGGGQETRLPGTGQAERRGNFAAPVVTPHLPRVTSPAVYEERPPHAVTPPPAAPTPAERFVGNVVGRTAAPNVLSSQPGKTKTTVPAAAPRPTRFALPTPGDADSDAGAVDIPRPRLALPPSPSGSSSTKARTYTPSKDPGDNASQPTSTRSFTPLVPAFRPSTRSEPTASPSPTPIARPDLLYAASPSRTSVQTSRGGSASGSERGAKPIESNRRTGETKRETPKEDVGMLAGEVWSILRRRLHHEAERRGRF